MSSQIVSVQVSCRKVCYMRRSLFVGILWIIFSVSAIAQGDWDSLCAHVHETGSVTVRGFAFKTYDATNPGDSACLGIFRDGKIMFLMAEDQKQYNLGQPGDARFKIPPVPNGVDLTGEGRPDMIVSSWSGGAHCCFNHFIFELEPKLRVLATIKDGDIDLAHFEKLGQDSGYYYVTSDIWSYWPASFASSVTHKVFLRWNGVRFKLDLDKMRNPPPTSQQWKAALKDVDDALKGGSNTRESLGVTLWNTTLDLIYTGHSDLAWQFVREANPNALKGDNPSLVEFCSELKDSEYWPDLKPTLTNVPDECARAKRGSRK